MPQAGKKPAARRPKAAKTAAKKGTKRSAKSAAKKPAKSPPPKGSKRSVKKKGWNRQSLTVQEILFWVFLIPQAKLQQTGVQLASATRGTPPIRVPKDGTTKLVGIACKLPVDANKEPALQFIQSRVFASEDAARAYIAEDPEGRALHDAADNDVLYKLIAG